MDQSDEILIHFILFLSMSYDTLVPDLKALIRRDYLTPLTRLCLSLTCWTELHKPHFKYSIACSEEALIKHNQEKKHKAAMSNVISPGSLSMILRLVDGTAVGTLAIRTETDSESQ